VSLFSPPISSRKVIDMLLGAVVMGTVGVLIGVLMDNQMIVLVTAAGVAMGAVIGMFGGRRFLMSILLGTILGGGLAWLMAGTDKVSLGAGAGAAMGGFLGVQSSMLLDLRAERKRASVAQSPRE